MQRSPVSLISVTTLIFCLIFSVGAAFAEPGVEQPRFAEGRILVKPAPGLSAEKFDKLLKRFERGAKVKRKLKKLPVNVVEVPPGRERALVRSMQRNPHIAFAELDELVAPDAIVNDPEYGNQWHLPLMGAPDAWQYSAGQDIIVAVLDTGVNGSHADLSGQVLSGYNTVSNDTNTADINNHGTWVAGVIAAKVNNGIGVASVAPQAKILPIRITNDSGGRAYFSDMAEGIRWAADNGARVANLSYSGAAGSSTVASAATYMMEKGGVVMVAAGNDNTDYGYTNHASLFVAGATTSSDGKASYSSFGYFVDISAPGSSIRTTSRSGGYSSVSGTSFATPNTAAVAALVLAANPGLLPTDVMTVITTTSVDLGEAGWDPIYGFGRVDAAAAAQMAASVENSDRTAPDVSLLTPGDGATVSDLVGVQVEAIDGFGIASVELWVDNVKYAETNQGENHVFVLSWDSKTRVDGTARLTARAIDHSGNVGHSQDVLVQVINVADSEPPTVSITSPRDGDSGDKRVVISASASDNVGVTQTSIYADGQLKCAGTGSVSCSWNLRKVADDIYTIRAVAKDAAGNSGSDEVTFTVGSTTTDSSTDEAPVKGRGRFK
jgi:hypothetical protein